MAKIYTNQLSTPAFKPTKPSAKTIKAILDFSKAFTIVRYKNLQFENIQN